LSPNLPHLAADEPRLLDIDGINDRLSDAYTHFHTSQAEFASDIAARDGTCVMTGEARWLCDAAHLIPHSKGDEVRLSALPVYDFP
jgi:hypothetical protein